MTKVDVGRVVGALVVGCAVGVGASAASAGGLTLVGSWDSSSCPTGAGCWGEGDLVFWGHWFEPCVDIINVSDPANPFLVAEYTPPPPNQFSSSQEIKSYNGLMFVGMEYNDFDGVDIVDIRDPANPTHLTWVTVPGYPDIHDLYYDNGWLYLADSRTNTFVIVDLRTYNPDSPPASITQAKWIITGVGTQFVHDIWVLNGRAYASAWDSVRVYDVTNIANAPPVFLGSGPGVSCHSVWATDDGQWAVTCEERTNGPAKLWEIQPGTDANTVTLTQRDEVVISGESSHNPFLVGDRCYIAWYSKGIRVFTIDRINKQLLDGPFYNPPGGNFWGAFPFLGPDRIIGSGFGSTALVVLNDEEVSALPALAAAASLNDHVGLGELAIDVDIAGTTSGDITTEPRSPGITRLALDFSSELDGSVGGLNEAAVDITSNPPGAVIPAITTSLSGDSLTLYLDFASALPDQYVYNVSVTDDVTTSAGDRDFNVRAMKGNVLTDAGAGPQVVNALDLGLSGGVRGHFGDDPADPANTRFDVNADGGIDALDYSFIRLTGGVFGNTAP